MGNYTTELTLEMLDRFQRLLHVWDEEHMPLMPHEIDALCTAARKQIEAEAKEDQAERQAIFGNEMPDEGAAPGHPLRHLNEVVAAAKAEVASWPEWKKPSGLRASQPPQEDVVKDEPEELVPCMTDWCAHEPCECRDNLTKLRVENEWLTKELGSARADAEHAYQQFLKVSEEGEQLRTRLAVNFANYQTELAELRKENEQRKEKADG